MVGSWLLVIALDGPTGFVVMASVYIVGIWVILVASFFARNFRRHREMVPGVQ